VSRLVVALGNPGSKYTSTRHNAGWLVLDHLQKKISLNWKNKFKGEYADLSINGDKVIFLKPQTFMNLSGESVVDAAQFFKIEPQNILVIHDELDLPYGTLAFKKGGGHAGHNGLRSIGELMGSLEFMRMRIGIGRPDRGSVSSWVLSPFSTDESAVFETYMDLCCEGLNTYLNNGFEKAASLFSKKNIGV